MAKPKLGAFVEDKSVKLTVELPAGVHRDLIAYIRPRCWRARQGSRSLILGGLSHLYSDGSWQPIAHLQELAEWVKRGRPAVDSARAQEIQKIWQSRIVIIRLPIC